MAAKKAKAFPAHVDRLYKAVDNYITKKGGALMVVGGIRIEEWPKDNKGVFHLSVRCTGRKPDYAEGESDD